MSWRETLGAARDLFRGLALAAALIYALTGCVVGAASSNTGAVFCGPALLGLPPCERGGTTGRPLHVPNVEAFGR